MNAPNSSSPDKDLESLRRAQRAYEPSMEEILASIRSIIADDKEAPAGAAKPVAPAGPQIVYSKDSPTLAPPAPALLAVAAPVDAAPAAPKQPWERPTPRVQPAPPPPAPAPQIQAAPPPEPSPAPAPAPAEEPFVSPVTDAAVSASFGALSASVALQNSEMVESLAREMLRPMLKTWLDDNLPSLVERLVRAEIQRVARGGR